MFQCARRRWFPHVSTSSLFFFKKKTPASTTSLSFWYPSVSPSSDPLQGGLCFDRKTHLSSEHTPDQFILKKRESRQEFRLSRYHSGCAWSQRHNRRGAVDFTLSLGALKVLPDSVFLVFSSLKTVEIQANLRETVVERWKKVRFGVIETLKGKWKGFSVYDERLSRLLWKAC